LLLELAISGLSGNMVRQYFMERSLTLVLSFKGGNIFE